MSEKLNRKSVADKLSETLSKTSDINIPYDEREQAKLTLEQVEKVYSFNEFQCECEDAEYELLTLDELTEWGGDWEDPFYLLCRAYYGYKYNPWAADDKREDFCPLDAYFFLNGYGNLVSVSEDDKYPYWADYLDVDEYVEEVENVGKLEELAYALDMDVEPLEEVEDDE